MKNIAIITNNPRLFNAAIADRLRDGWGMKGVDGRIAHVWKGGEHLKLWRVQSINDVRGVLFSGSEVRIDPHCFHLADLSRIELYLETHKQG